MIDIQRILVKFTCDECLADDVAFLLTTIRSKFCLLHDLLLPSLTVGMDKDWFIRLVDDYLNIGQLSEMAINKKCSACFETSRYITVILWSMISKQVGISTLPKHLLQAMFCLKHYWTNNSNATLQKCDLKAFRKWTS